MRIAIAFRGITYCENYLHKYNKIFDIDFRDTADSIFMNLISPLQQNGNSIDTFFSTYHHRYEKELIDLYKPKKIEFLEYSLIPSGKLPEKIGYSIICNQWLKCIDLIQEHEKETNSKYDFIIITRADLYFYKSIMEIGIDFNAINVPFYHLVNLCNGNWKFSTEDCWFAFHSDKLDIVKESLNHLIEINEITHMIGYDLILKGETIKYLYGEKGDGAIDYPFYKIGRYLFGNAKEITIDDIPNIRLNRIYNTEEEKHTDQGLYMSLSTIKDLYPNVFNYFVIRDNK